MPEEEKGSHRSEGRPRRSGGRPGREKHKSERHGGGGRRDREDSGRRRSFSSDRPRRPPRKPRPPVRTSPENDTWSHLSDDELREQMRDLILGANLMETGFGARRFYFVSRDKRVTSMDISPDLASRLTNGQAALVEVPGSDEEEYTVIPWDLAEKIKTVDPECVRFLNTESEGGF